ncbi:MAG: hypothetical protein RL141_715 [Candidatus Parcubacteria bacterium]|jgi:hypothetical protein
MRGARAGLTDSLTDAVCSGTVSALILKNKHPMLLDDTTMAPEETTEETMPAPTEEAPAEETTM